MIDEENYRKPKQRYVYVAVAVIIGTTACVYLRPAQQLLQLLQAATTTEESRITSETRSAEKYDPIKPPAADVSTEYGLGHDTPSCLHHGSQAANLCWSLHQQARKGKQCYEVQTEHAIRLLLCTKHGNSTGSLFIQDNRAAGIDFNTTMTNNTNSTAQPCNVYSLRVVGAEIQRPPLLYCGPLAVARFSIQTPGDFTLELLQLYDNFTFIEPSLLRRDIHVATFRLHVPPTSNQAACLAPSTPLPTVGRRLLSNQGNSRATNCPVCTGFNHAGRWVLAPNTTADAATPVLQALHHTCIRQLQPAAEFMGCPLVLRPPSTPAVEDNKLLEWLPYSCRYHKLSPADSAACQALLSKQAGGKVCFIGDSQMRHLHNQVAHLVEGQATRFRETITGEARQKEVVAAGGMMYVADEWGDRALAFNSSNCSHVFANFGQWPLSYFTPQPWTPRHYAEKVESIARHLQQQQGVYGNKHFWVTVPPHPISQFHQEKLPAFSHGIDWRTEPFVIRYNAVASSIMQAHGIPMVDTYSITAPLVDLSYDGAHFLGTVGLAQARMVANILCSPVLPQP